MATANSAQVTFLYGEGGIYVLERVAFSGDKDIDVLVKCLNCPLGTIPAGGGDVISNPGYPVSIMAEINLKLYWFCPCHLQQCCRTPAPTDVTLELVHGMREQKEYAKNFKVTSKLTSL
jgi:hypothetical protein